ncbi:MAG: GNAT family N-acetyltransferase [Bdellovibrionales bacterium]|nr:GNAT family N-acetyltransferase [Bdellovibrionales bacterium]
MLTLRRLDPRDPRSEQELQELLSATPRYTERVSGVSFCPPGAAREALDITPPKTTAEQKFVFVLDDAGTGSVGCVDLIRDYPVAHCAFLGLLTIREPQQGRGLGR